MSSPCATISISPKSVVEGQPFTGPVITFNDTGYPTNVPSDFSAFINWGDGTTILGTIVAGATTGSFTVNSSHTYAEEGSFPLSVTVADDLPGSADLTFDGPVLVADAPLTASPVNVRATEGKPLTNVDVATFTDADPLGTATDFVAGINWGDGTATAGTIVEDDAGNFHVQGSHTYTEEGASIPISVTIVDNGNGRAVNDPLSSRVAASSTANVRAGTAARRGQPCGRDRGAAIPTGTAVATFTDTGGGNPVGDYLATIDWGDGSPLDPATVSRLGNGGNFVVKVVAPHTYAEEGHYGVIVSIGDVDVSNLDSIPTTAQTITSATVTDARLLPGSFQPTVVGTERMSFTEPVAAFTDANPGRACRRLHAPRSTGATAPRDRPARSASPAAPARRST